MSKTKNKYEKLFAQIKENSKVGIYGTCDLGLEIRKKLKIIRPDIKLVCFLDSFKSGKIDDIDIKSPFDFENLNCEFDYIIISSIANKNNIEIILNNLNFYNIIFLNKNFSKSNQGFVVSEELYKKYKTAKNIFETKDERKLYEMLFSNILSSFKNNKKLLKFNKKLRKKYFKNEVCPHYCEYLNKDIIKTAIDGGANTGQISTVFASQFKNVQKIYAFEPLYHLCKKEFEDKLISKNDKIEIVEKALWDKKETLQFKAISQAAYTGSAIKDVSNTTTLNKKGDFIDVEAISIDEFVAENNVEKVDFIKMDLENSELNALNGAIETIQRDRPQMAICIYHSFEQFIEIPVFFDKMLDNYVYKLYYDPIDRLCEVIIQAIPKEHYQKRYHSLWKKIFKKQ